MPLEPQGPATVPEQAVSAPDDGQTDQHSTGTGTGQPEGDKSTGTEQPPKGNQDPEESFFDVRSIQDNPELLKAYKQMQTAFTKKTREIAAHRQKIQEYDAFMANPVEQIQQLAARYGLQVSRAEARQMAKDAAEGGGNQSGGDWQPKSWDDVLQRARSEAESAVLQKLAPVINGVQKIQAGNIEKELDEIDPEWRTYEDNMREVMREHPSLVRDVKKLYRLAVPEEVQTMRATKLALEKMQSKVQSSTVSGGNRGVRKTSQGTAVINSFQDAVKEARRILAEQ